MACSYKENAVLHLYGETPAGFESHLAQCAECSEFVQDSRRVLDLYRSTSREGPLAFPSQKVGRSRRNRTWVGLAVAASLAFAVGLVYVSMWNDAGSSGAKNVVAATQGSNSAEDWWNIDDDITRLAQDSVRVFNDESSRLIDDQIKQIDYRIGLMIDADAF